MCLAWSCLLCPVILCLVAALEAFSSRALPQCTKPASLLASVRGPPDALLVVVQAFASIEPCARDVARRPHSNRNMDQVGAYDLQLANRLIEDYKDKAADIIAQLLNRDEKIRADVHQLFVLNPRNGPQSPCAPPGLLNTEAPATHRSSSLHSGSPPPHPQHGARRGISTDSIPMSPPRTASSLGSRSARGGSSTREYILVPYHTGSEVKERIIQMNTAAIQSSVIRADLVSRIGLDVDREEGFVQLPHPTEPNSWIPL